MQLRETSNPAEMLSIAWQLKERLPQLRDNEIFLYSIPYFLQSPAHKFFVVEDELSERISERSAFGLLTFYKNPMDDRVMLAVEALWFADEQLENQLWIWAAIASIAKRMEFHGVCISEQSVNTPATLSELLKRGELNGDPVGLVHDLPLQGATEGVYSAFTEKPGSAAFFASCYRIYTLKELVDFEGVPSDSTKPLYRGEGRIKIGPYEHCKNLEELIEEIFNSGFPARGSGDFFGTVQQQILQQGYVNQPTASLTESFDVAAYYATDKHNPDRKRAVVFTIDRELLRRNGEVYDSYATMKKHCYWFMKGEFDTLVKIVQALGVQKAGSFLNQCYEETHRRVIESGGLDSLIGFPNWIEYFGEDEWNKLGNATVKEEQLESLFNAFEGFWMHALGQVGLAEKLVLDELGGPPKVSSETVGLLGYYLAFDAVKGHLKAALDDKRAEAERLGKPLEYRHTGWDLTAFGYIAKTCRDQEFFSSGPIPGNCITEATIVNSDGSPLQTIMNTIKHSE
jgi:hypothetical protein